MSRKCKITVTDEVNCVITGLFPSEQESLYNTFGLFAEGYFFNPSFKFGGWDGKVRFYAKTGKTYIRLLDKILPHLEKWGYDIELEDNRKLVTNPTMRASVDMFGNIQFRGKPCLVREYQVEAINTLVDAGSGILIAATAAGKTMITAGISHIYASIGCKVITIVPSADLVGQTIATYESLGLDTGIYSGEDKDLDHKHIVASWQAIQYNPTILLQFSALIWDEAQGCKADVAKKLLNENGKHIAFRFGVTGTMPKPPSDQMAIFSAIGPILKEIPAEWLIANGYLAEVEIQPIELNETYVIEEFENYAAEKSFLAKSPDRLEMIADIIISECAANGNTLVLVNDISFGKKLTALIKGAVFLYGNSSSDLRKEHYDMFEEHDDLIVIATVGIASTGISIDRIFCLVFVDAGKSFVKCIQGLGRSMRIGRDKTKARCVDIHSKLKYAKKHAKERLKHYAEAKYPVLKKQVIKVYKSIK
jgi:superfamily II DNA or RNA helicase